MTNHLLVLFLVIALGSLLGRFKVCGFHLGVAAILFAGLGIGALDPDYTLPEVVYQIGLVLFVFSVGLSSGPALLSSLKGRGLQENLLALGSLLLCGAFVFAAALLLEIGAGKAGGMYAGALTNTPALAAVIDSLKARSLPDIGSNSVVAYSAAYPAAVLIPIALIALFSRLWKIDYPAEARQEGLGASGEQLKSMTIKISNPEVAQYRLQHLVKLLKLQVVFGRIRHGDSLEVCTGATRFAVGDTVTMVGAPEDLQHALLKLGQESSEQIDLDRSVIDYRRIFVSNPEVTACPISSLNLSRRFGAIISRIRRGDADFIPHPGSMLQLGDRVRVIAQSNKLPALSKYFGDSYQSVSEIDILSYTLGLAAGIGLGLIPIPLPGGTVLKLGLAGGPLVLALILSALRRTGPFSWALPYSVNTVTCQLGLTLFLAGIGTRAGGSFVEILSSSTGLILIMTAALVSTLSTLLILTAGYHLMGISFSRLTGILAAAHTQPAILAFASEQSGNEAPLIAYSSVYPFAMVIKIIIAQLIVAFLL